MEYDYIVSEILSDDMLKYFIFNSLSSSMKGLDYSAELINDLTAEMSQLNIGDFTLTHSIELSRVNVQNFCEDMVPRYFGKYILPEIPSECVVLDLGCGTGVLARLLAERGGQSIFGMDIQPFPEWEETTCKYVQFDVVRESGLENYLRLINPDTVMMTWVLHHMEYDQQERYLKQLHNTLGKGTKLVILEDSYSESILPEAGMDKHKEFFKWSNEDRHKIMAVLDWMANRVLGQKKDMPVPATYRTLEEWSDLMICSGFKVKKARYLGFPEDRDVNTPQSLLVLER